MINLPMQNNIKLIALKYRGQSQKKLQKVIYYL